MCSPLGMLGEAAGGVKPAMLGGAMGMLAARKKGRNQKDNKPSGNAAMAA